MSEIDSIVKSGSMPVVSRRRWTFFSCLLLCFVVASVACDLWVGWKFVKVILVATGLACTIRVAQLTRQAKPSEGSTAKGRTPKGFVALNGMILLLACIGFASMAWKVGASIGTTDDGPLLEQRSEYRLKHRGGDSFGVSREQFVLAGLLTTAFWHSLAACFPLVVLSRTLYCRWPFGLKG